MSKTLSPGKVKKANFPKYTFRSMHLRKLQEVADEEKRSLNAHLELLIEKDLKERGKL